jgi:putative ABC transport system substrate-binding protein
VSALWDPESDAGQLRASEVGAKGLGAEPRVLRVGRPEEFDAAFVEAQKTHADALVVLSSAVFAAHGGQLVTPAAKHRLPTMYHQKDFVAAGGRPDDPAVAAAAGGSGGRVIRRAPRW